MFWLRNNNKIIFLDAPVHVFKNFIEEVHVYSRVTIWLEKFSFMMTHEQSCKTSFPSIYLMRISQNENFEYGYPNSNS